MCAGSNPGSRTPHGKRYAWPVDREYQPTRPCESRAFWLLFENYKDKDWKHLSKDFNALVAVDQAMVNQAFERKEQLPVEGEEMRMTNPKTCEKFNKENQLAADRVAVATASQSNKRAMEPAQQAGIAVR